MMNLSGILTIKQQKIVSIQLFKNPKFIVGANIKSFTMSFATYLSEIHCFILTSKDFLHYFWQIAVNFPIYLMWRSDCRRCTNPSVPYDMSSIAFTLFVFERITSNITLFYLQPLFCGLWTCFSLCIVQCTLYIRNYVSLITSQQWFCGQLVRNFVTKSKKSYDISLQT